MTGLGSSFVKLIDCWKGRAAGAAGMVLLVLIALPTGVRAAGGPLGIDHRLGYDESGIWARQYSLGLERGTVLLELGGALWLGGKSKLGRTFWQSLDASVGSALISAQVLKYAFGRLRPAQTSNPNEWFSHGQSFPSGEVTLQASFVTPFILAYRRHHPWIWSLEALPLYDAEARMKEWGHWQTDVLAGWALGTAWGVYAAHRHSPFMLSIMPHSVVVGLHEKF
ncbi:MAG: phosphatase PAP2 family protein [Pseudomonadota bacterium]|nr:phosphatase PAP2 family protein [Pseudomonadota bacterium]